jgi:hypothetical protein
MMERREFITLLGGAAAWPLAARAQQPERMPVVGFLGGTSPDTFADRLHAFRQGLKDTGYVEGETLGVEYRWAESQNARLPGLVAARFLYGLLTIGWPRGHVGNVPAGTLEEPRLPPEAAMAVELSDVERRRVMAGGVTVANFPQAARNFRRSSSVAICHDNISS